MAYREVSFYVVVCDYCGIVAPDGGTAGWWTPTIADHAALEAGWALTATEHLCPVCRPLERQVDVADAADGGAASEPRPAIRPASPAPPRPDVCWPPSPSPPASSPASSPAATHTTWKETP